MGQAVAPFRNEVLVATKFGFKDGSESNGLAAGPRASGRWRTLP